jgi:hypothetical protein
MKARFKYKPNEHGNYIFDLCKEYPNCNCDGHYVWEKKKTKEGDCCPMSEFKKGCGKKFDSHIWGNGLNCGQIEDLKHSDHILLCEECKKEDALQSNSAQEGRK